MVKNERSCVQNKLFQLLVACLIPNVGGWIVLAILYFKFQQTGEVKQIEPSYFPPKWIVIPTWTAMFFLMGVASWRVWTKHNGLSGKARNTLLIYLAKVFLIWMWPLIAFGLESNVAAVVQIGILLYFVIFTGILFFRLDKLAGILFIPYVAYVTFATVLCVHVYILNK